MFHQLFHAVYTQPLQNVLIMIAVAVPLWALISSLLPKKELKVVSLCILSFSLLFTLWITLFGRVPSDEYVPVFMPLSIFYRATENREMLRSALMNVFLFVPFGMTLPFILPDRLKHRLPITVAAAAVNPRAVAGLCFAAFCSSSIAYTLQIVAQDKVKPTIASLTMSLESVFAVLAGWAILGEQLSAREICGCDIMMVAIVFAQIRR